MQFTEEVLELFNRFIIVSPKDSKVCTSVFMDSNSTVFDFGQQHVSSVRRGIFPLVKQFFRTFKIKCDILTGISETSIFITSFKMFYPKIYFPLPKFQIFQFLQTVACRSIYQIILVWVYYKILCIPGSAS